jgi:hypothetical protein
MLTRRRYATLIASLVLATCFLPSPRADAAKECFGKRVTMKVTVEVPFVGSPNNDVILGTSSDDVIDGGGGNDRICSLGGNDTVQGGLGNDKINGGPGVDILVGDIDGSGPSVEGGGDDVIKGGDGLAQFMPSIRFELIIGDSRSADGPVTGGGDDSLDGGPDGALMIGDSVGADGTFGGGNDRLRRGAGTIVGDSWGQVVNQALNVTGSGDDVIEETRGAPSVIVGDSRADAGASGSAVVFNNTDQRGNDIITATSGDDIIVGDHEASGDSTAFVGSGDDTIKALGGADNIFGDCSIGLDPITSSAQSPLCDELGVENDGGDDNVNAGGGDDVILAGYGKDAMNGGPDTDACDGQGSLTDTQTNCEQVINVP